MQAHIDPVEIFSKIEVIWARTLKYDKNPYFTHDFYNLRSINSKIMKKLELPLENSFIYFEDLNPMSLQLPFETGLNVPVSVVVKL